METFVRPLSEKERRLLTGALRWRQRRLKDQWKRLLSIGLIVFVVFSILPMIASRGQAYIPVLAWLGIVSLLCIWAYFSERPKARAELGLYERALKRNESRVTRIQSDDMVELEEDEGACYAFQLSNQRIVFISGQDYYPSARFPNTDFSLVEIYGENKPLIEVLEKNGTKLRPSRKIPAPIKSKLQVPDHLGVIEGRLDELEQLLKAYMENGGQRGLPAGKNP